MSEVRLRKIDCVLVRVDDLAAASRFYAERLGLRELWRDESSAGMGLPETDAEVVLHTMDLPPAHAVHYLVEDVRAAAASWRESGLEVRTEPFEIAVGWCAILADPFGNAVCVLDLTGGARSGSAASG
ncbi:VOC family protein [Actinoplanes sp. KI2]|uniref:VOC family protein n=1 Tax=Actinoplanes sp. KI2 TaxID=2983315 RepID=UPI0021D5E22C|nr:VOC family protein [Actinoplanes sp. KI2]MCU7722798.1 VOC family protein [Actinoplanes sp. KI2]